MRPDQPPDHRQVADRLEQLVVRSGAALSVAVQTSGGWMWANDADRVLPSASTIKVPILVAALRAVEAGRLSLGQQVTLRAERVGGAGPLQLLPSVVALPLRETLSLMVAVSDNDATNAVVDLLGFPAVADALAAVPTRHTVLQRRMMDVDAARAGRPNLTSAADLVALLVALREGRLLGPQATTAAVATLREQQWRDGLPAYLPPDVLVASKTGDLTGLRADCALMERDGRWVAVAALADGLASDGPRGVVDRGTAVLPVFAAIGEICGRLL